jgi:hypothetical protein
MVLRRWNYLFRVGAPPGMPDEGESATPPPRRPFRPSQTKDLNASCVSR